MSASSETKQIYVCESFGVLDPAETSRMQEWLNEQAEQGYRLCDRQVLESGGATKRMSLVMELLPEPESDPESEPEGGSEEGGA